MIRWRLGAAVCASVLAAAFALPAEAQEAPGSRVRMPNPEARTIMPWEKNLRQFYRRQQRLDPATGLYTRSNQALRQLYRDPMLRLGYEPNRPPPTGSPATAPTEPVIPPEFTKLDANGDGGVTRDEYFNGRERMVPLGPNAISRQKRQIRRLDSRFRYADRNADGVVSAEEISEIPGVRF